MRLISAPNRSNLVGRKLNKTSSSTFFIEANKFGFFLTSSLPLSVISELSAKLGLKIIAGVRCARNLDQGEQGPNPSSWAHYSSSLVSVPWC